MIEKVEAIVIGAGVVGLAIGRALARRGLETLIIEAGPTYGQGVSSRNSEVIHAGLYYRPGSLKAQLCRPGREALYAYCQAKHINHQQVGKWVVATNPEQSAKLDSIYQKALANGCDEVYFIPGEQARELEPQLKADKVLVSPRTGIVDSHGLMTALLGDFEAAGGMVAYASPVIGIKSQGGEHIIETGGNEPLTLRCRYLVNAAGLGAVGLAHQQTASNGGIKPSLVPSGCFAKGNYFSLSGKSPFSRLIYPIPQEGGLGVHLTLDLQGRAKFGPDVQWVDVPDYQIDAGRAAAFVEAVGDYWPEVDASRLQPDYAGVRPKLGTQDGFSDDFLLLGPSEHGQPGLMHMLGIESPGLTSCLSLADLVCEKLL